MPEPGLRRELSHVPVTAAALYTSRQTGRSYVLAGEHAQLLVYAASGGGSPSRVDVFATQLVHGIRVDDGQHAALVWGGSEVALVRMEERGDDEAEMVQVRLEARAVAGDYIYDAAPCPWDGALAAVVTAHNEVVLLAQEPGPTLRLGDAVSPSRPMLYAARLVWTGPRCLLVAAGTVFGDVVVWRCAWDCHGGARLGVVGVLSGHEGSVYGVDISPALTHADGSVSRLVASCSDDRSVRVWHLADASALLSPSACSADTGFKSTPSHAATHEPLAVAMGHASRIWGVRFGLTAPLALQRDSLSLALYTFGEDATAQRWCLHLSLALPSTGRLTHCKTYALHDGKHLWAGTTLSSQALTLIATGGADGKVCIITDAASTQHADDQTDMDDGPRASSLVVIDVDDLAAPSSAPRDGEIISRYDFVTDEQILLITSLGRLFLGSLASKPCWQPLAVDASLKAHLELVHVLRSVGNGAAILGATDGNVMFFQPSGHIVRIASVPGRISEITYLSASYCGNSEAKSPVHVLLHLHGTPASHYLTLDPSTGHVQRHEHLCGLDARFVIVCSALIGSLLVLGSRRGWLSFLTRQHGVWRPVLQMATRSRDAITAIVALPDKANPRLPSPYILTTSRDGKYRIHDVRRHGESSVSAQLVHETSPPLGPMIEGAWFTEAQSELVLYGFRGKDFVVWNETRHEEMARVDCGGAHRTFRLSYHRSDAERCRFAFTRASKLFIFCQLQRCHGTLKSGIHGREIRALSCNGLYVATGAEDTTIRIWEYRRQEQQGQGHLRHLACIKAHVTGMQRLRWLGDEYLFSSAGNEEFFVWRVRALDSACKALGVVCEASLTDKSRAGDLRIMDFEASRWNEAGDGALLTLALSNSTLKTYRYSAGGGFELRAVGSYTGACLTQVRHLGIGRDEWCVLSASTDGHLALWRGRAAACLGGVGEYSLEGSIKVHQSSIKSLDMAGQGQGSWAIITGGDDNGLGMTTAGSRGQGHDDICFLTSGVVRQAHAAAINGVVVLASTSNEVVRAISVSNDQQVKLWETRPSEATRMVLLSSASSGVADAGDAGQLGLGDGKDNSVVVGGVGLEVWRLGGLDRQRQ
ncbi:hypothetical protein CDD81_3158 [Ophiocordyceps australis]|uniref:Uncharacterized protein n=1 Tax=Ophiocordyceps australis TaxID=1399860 RepID=A0A2C5XXZ3_9HYPO|nr:hypothetical protein CDD81_3158 [Ophiocordyceps australis]